MKRLFRWALAATLICGIGVLMSCSTDDNPVVEPTTEVLRDGVWTGSGEGRSGTIIVRMTVEDHQIADIVVVSQSESSFAQEALNEMVARALRKQGWSASAASTAGNRTITTSTTAL